MRGRSGRRRWGERLFWNVQSLTWDDLLQKPRHRQRMEAALGLMTSQARSGDRILDIGCGTGTYSVALARSGFEVVGLDFAPAMLRRAETKAGGLLGARVQFFRADFNQPFPFGDETFDHAICVCALHCVADPAAFMGEVHRVLAPGGRFVVVALAGRTEGTPGSPLRTTLPRKAFWRMKRRMVKGRRWARYSRDELLDLLRRSGFEVGRRLESGPALLVPRDGSGSRGTV